MTHGHEKSEPCHRAVKLMNKARKLLRRRLQGRSSGAWWSEGAGRREGAPAKHVPELVTQARVSQGAGARRNLRRHRPEAGAVRGKAARTDLGAGRAMKCTSLPLRRREFVGLVAVQPLRKRAIGGANQITKASTTMISRFRRNRLRDRTGFRLVRPYKTKKGRG